MFFYESDTCVADWWCDHMFIQNKLNKNITLMNYIIIIEMLILEYFKMDWQSNLKIYLHHMPEYAEAS